MLRGGVGATEGRRFVVRKLLALPHFVVWVPPPPEPLGWIGPHQLPAGAPQRSRTLAVLPVRAVSQGVRGPLALGPTFHFLTVSVPRHSCVVIGDHVREGLGAFLGGRPVSPQRNHQQVSCLAWTRLVAA